MEDKLLFVDFIVAEFLDAYPFFSPNEMEEYVQVWLEKSTSL